MSSNKRYPSGSAVPPRALSHLPEINIVEPPRPRNRPPPLRNLPPPSWSSPGPSPPLTSLATPFSTDMFVMPYPNPVATMTPGLLSPNYTPPHSPIRRGQGGGVRGECHSVPITPRSDPMEEIYSPPFPYRQERPRRRSSLASFESTTETIRPWHVIQLTPKPSRAQLSDDKVNNDNNDNNDKKNGNDKEGRPLRGAEPVIVRPGDRTDRWRYPNSTPNILDDHLQTNPIGLSLETLVCDWDFESDSDRDQGQGRGRPVRSSEALARRKRLRLGAKLRAEARAMRESIERDRVRGESPARGRVEDTS